MADVFISYAREDRAQAERLTQHLAAAGLDVWQDIESLRVGALFSEAIEQALHNARAVIVLWSTNSANSKWVRVEADLAWQQDKLCSVVISPATKVPFPFRDRHWLDMSEWNGSGKSRLFERLLRDLGSLLEDQMPAEDVSGAPAWFENEKDRGDQHGTPQPTSVGGAGPSEPPRNNLLARHPRLAVGSGLALALVGALAVSLYVIPPRSQSGDVVPASPISVNPNQHYSPKPMKGDVPAVPVSEKLNEPEMVEIRPGEGKFPSSFRMGSEADEPGAGSDERPRHDVKFAKPFAIGRYEVTSAQYDQFAVATGKLLPNHEGWGRGNRPVINVTWADATAYAEWLKTKTGKPYRLPTEAEWEYVARAGSQGQYWWCPENKPDCGIDPDRANCDGCGSTKGLEAIGLKTLPVGSFPANRWGLSDTAGNVWEWVQDCWHENYEGAPADGTAWKEETGGDCGRRVVRGGSWGGNPGGLRSAYRGKNTADDRGDGVGFRLAQDL